MPENPKYGRETKKKIKQLNKRKLRGWFGDDERRRQRLKEHVEINGGEKNEAKLASYTHIRKLIFKKKQSHLLAPLSVELI